jgi:hypothetical protein
MGCSPYRGGGASRLPERFVNLLHAPPTDFLFPKGAPHFRLSTQCWNDLGLLPHFLQPNQKEPMTTSCSHHCRACGTCFTSLRAFDLHRTGPMSDRSCDLAGADLVERTGVCKVANPELPVAGLTVHERRDTAEYRERMNAALTASRKL